MSESELIASVSDFFSRYNAAFATVDGDRIAALYNLPTVTMRGDGSIHCMQSRAELAQFFQGVVDGYHRDGYRDGRFENLQVVPIGGRSVLATMDWALLRADGSVLRAWRQSYNLVDTADGWRILVSTFHIGRSDG
jgi:hypothetical protein